MMDSDEEAFSEVEDDDASIGPMQVNWQYFTGYTTYRVGLNIEVAQQPSSSRSVIEVRSPPFNFVIILHDRDVEDDEVVEDEETVQIFLSNNEGDVPQPPSLMQMASLTARPRRICPLHMSHSCRCQSVQVPLSHFLDSSPGLSHTSDSSLVLLCRTIASDFQGMCTNCLQHLFM